jgi:hypothetical protein
LDVAVKLSKNSEMRDRKVLTIDNEDIKGEDYRLLIEVAFDKCNRFAFVQRRDLMENENVAMEHFYKLVENIKDSFIEMKEQSEWETTELLDSTAYVFYYELNEKTKAFLLNKSNSLFGWISPYLPEDLMLYKDTEVWLAGCSHECLFTINEDFKNFDELIEYLRNA